jgi:penicillin-binding protein 1A
VSQYFSKRHIQEQLVRLREQLVCLRQEVRGLRDRHPREFRAAVGTAGAAGALALVLVVGCTWFVLSLSRTLPNQESITRMGEMAQATAVYDAKDAPVFTIFTEQRIEVPLKAISRHLVDAILAVEDQRFYGHRGFDVIRIASAAVTNVREQRVAQGGSTITQQLARTSFLTAEKTIRRKLQELILAARIERTFSKARILELYLNKVYFGDGLYGVEAASRGFFGKHASEVTVAEAATLAGLVKSPSKSAPTINVERATARRNVVLQAMLDAGVIDKGVWQAARSENMSLRDTLRADEPYGRYFKEQVRRELVDRFGWRPVYEGGLRVFSTIDMDMQKAAEAAVAEGLKTLDERRKALAARSKKQPGVAAGAEPLQAALVAIDVATGHVRAMVGGRDFTKSSFNRVVQAKRQPGSAFKPFVYAAALEAGYTPATVIDNLNMPIATLQGAWTPDDGHSSAPQMTLRTGLRTSSNRAAVRLLQEVGIPETVGYARTMGIGDVPNVPSLALGSGEVTLQAMTAAYAAFANRGLVPTPIVIRRVEDRDGRVLYASEESPRRAISETTAFLMTTMLSDVINAGTATRVRRAGFTLPAAGKTGTTNDFKDAWFVGFTPTMIAGVWVGFDQPRTIMPNGFASEVAVPIWAGFMKAATRHDKPRAFAAPAGITSANVCRLSGKLASNGCADVEVVTAQGTIERRSMIYTEYFARGTMPAGHCHLHPTRGFFDTIASVFGGKDAPAPARADAAGVPARVAPAAVATAGVAADARSTAAVATAGVSAPPIAPVPLQKKRGFWSRVLGIDKDDK